MSIVTNGFLVKKLGMTRIFEENRVVPVTLAEIVKNEVIEKKDKDKVVLGVFKKNKLKKNNNKNFVFKKEFKVDEKNFDKLKIGEEIDLSNLLDLKKCFIISKSKGKGFAGVIKRYNFSRGPETHGSHHHRKPGSIGQCASPARVIRGKKMPGRMGNDKVTLKNIEIVDIDTKNNVIAIKTPVPGSINCIFEIYPS